MAIEQERQAARDNLAAVLEGGWSDDLSRRVMVAFVDPPAEDLVALVDEVVDAVALLVPPDEAGDDLAFGLAMDAYLVHPAGAVDE